MPIGPNGYANAKPPGTSYAPFVRFKIVRPGWMRSGVQLWWPPVTVSPMLDFDRRPARPVVPLPAPSWAGVSTSTLPATDLAAPRPAPQCLTHQLLVLTTAGHGTVEIDFADQPCRPGTLLRVRPGQALRFGGQPGLDAAIIAWDRDLHPAGDIPGFPLDDPFGPARWQLAGEDEDAVINEFAQLAFDCDRLATIGLVTADSSPNSGGTPNGGGPGADRAVAAALLRHQRAGELLRIALLTAADPPAATDAESRTFARFRRELEDGHPDSRRVEDYAARLGCSVRTLTRASLAVTGRTAKQVVDDRVALEARRLLACTQLSVAEVGRRLGFGEPTNFGRFFHREVGESPGAFRAGIGHRTSDPVRRAVPLQRAPADSL